ncbi:DUF1707 and DUF2154 domain-containing protein [Natronosporangium hydrolyticum]|uniref:DUF1707 and DUF2154 domain-containing protein n=1 Tax=Natronosporangium hydrolyticum TaxID=2811111 RepID=A0A895YMA8_9ACTN|nr:DUF1707 domain-containing protein [Natronosporangium hydrolyticum]QSB15028.1 DUF1707 and DUF2154 domain-containing protein [Natronosporangium hydrolyticum]
MVQQPTSQQRQTALDQLTAAVEAGRLTLDGFSDRTAAVYRATTPAELATVVHDLPPLPVGVEPAVVEHTPVGAVKRGGRWLVPARAAITTTVGAIKLDLVGAELPTDGAEVLVRARVGTIKVWLPDRWRVEISGTSTVGGRRIEENHPHTAADAPVLRLRLDTTVGTVKVYRT